jgi:hypothetical protein
MQSCTGAKIFARVKNLWGLKLSSLLFLSTPTIKISQPFSLFPVLSLVLIHSYHKNTTPRHNGPSSFLDGSGGRHSGPSSTAAVTGMVALGCGCGSSGGLESRLDRLRSRFKIFLFLKINF